MQHYKPCSINICLTSRKTAGLGKHLTFVFETCTNFAHTHDNKQSQFVPNMSYPRTPSSTSPSPSSSEGADRVGGQLRGGKDVSLVPLQRCNQFWQLGGRCRKAMLDVCQVAIVPEQAGATGTVSSLILEADEDVAITARSVNT